MVLTDRMPGCDPNVGDLAPGQEVVLRCVMTAPQDDQSPRATAGSRDPLGSSTTAHGDGTLDVVHAKLVISKTDKTPVVRPGSTVTFRVTVRNTGDVTLRNVVVADPLAPACSWTVPRLRPGARSSRTCTMVADDSFTNWAEASARPVLGVAVLGRQLSAAGKAAVAVEGTRLGQTPRGDGSALPHTGGDVPRLLRLGVTLLLSGAGVLVAAARPRRRRREDR